MAAVVAEPHEAIEFLRQAFALDHQAVEWLQRQAADEFMDTVGATWGKTFDELSERYRDKAIKLAEIRARRTGVTDPNTLVMDELNRLISALYAALRRMEHPSGGTYWDHTLVAFGSEFGRTARGGRFNSAGGSDHAGDYATRWMSMPLMGGVIEQAGKGGASLGETRREDLAPLGKVYSYRAVMKTLMDMLGADHAEFFPADEPFSDITA